MSVATRIAMQKKQFWDSVSRLAGGEQLVALGFLHQSSFRADRALVTLWRVPESRNDKASRTFDSPGAVLATLVWGALTYAVIKVPASGSPIWISGLAGLCALAGFLVVETQSPAPMISLHLFRSRDFSGTTLLTFLLYVPLSHWSGGLVARYGARLRLTIGPRIWMAHGALLRTHTKLRNPIRH
jgi:hypothetical protein